MDDTTVFSQIMFFLNGVMTYVLFFERKILLENQQKLRYLQKIYTYMYIPPPAAYTNTIHNT